MRRSWFVPVLLSVGATAAAPTAAFAHGVAAPEPTLGALAIWLPDPVPWIGCVVAAWLYVGAAGRVNATHPGNPVPTWRLAAWLAGLLTILVALTSAIDIYADDLLTVHMVQHLLLTLVAPPLLALGAPMTLLLRVATPTVRQRFLLPLLHSRFVRLTTRPLVAWLAFAAVMVATHFTPLYDAALEDPLVHDAEHLLYLASGLLFWWPVVAADPVPQRMNHFMRLVYLLAMVPVGSIVGLAVYFAPSVLYEHYATLVRPWGPSALVDQQVGGLVMWAAGDVLLLLAVALVVADWMRADERRSVILDARRSAAQRAAARSAGRLEDVQRREQEEPDDVDEMPVVADGFDRGVPIG